MHTAISAESCNCGTAAIGQLKAGLEGLPVGCRWGVGEVPVGCRWGAGGEVEVGKSAARMGQSILPMRGKCSGEWLSLEGLFAESAKIERLIRENFRGLSYGESAVAGGRALPERLRERQANVETRARAFYRKRS